MAEKEERISIELLKDDFCDSCDNRGKLKNCCCYEKQEYDERYKKSLLRQEAIKRMAKAICKRGAFGCESCVFGKDKEKCGEWLASNHIRDAEAALNALLGE